MFGATVGMLVRVSGTGFQAGMDGPSDEHVVWHAYRLRT
jgi:hypothetical protein